MEAPLELAGEFPPATAEGWRAAVDKVLAGRDADLAADYLDRRFEQRLVTTTYDGIAVQPLYTSDELPRAAAERGTPGSWPYVRGATLLGCTPDGWDVRQAVELDQLGGRGSEVVVDQLEKGATSVLLRAGASVDVDHLDDVLDGVHLDLVTIALDCGLGTGGASALLELWRRKGIEPAAARGVLGLDPLGEAASAGRSRSDEEVEAAVDLARSCASSWPAARSFVVDATRYHEAGAADVEELAWATATGVAYLRLLTEAGLDPEAAFGQLEFRLAATADQFSTIAKLRAARQLWSRVAQVVGVPDAGGQRQHALTSRAMLSRYDPAVNLLRNTTACFAAGVGGADAITVEPHDVLVDPGHPTTLGRRMARNTQLLLIEETHLGRVLDPGGGSWYVEALTTAMAERAWAGFTEIEQAGGMDRALEDGMVRDRIESTWADRVGRLATREDTIVGVNDFPNAADDIPAPPEPTPPSTPSGGLPRRRYAGTFEALRERTDEHERAHGSRPKVALVRLGSLAASTARATYAKSFFETAGFRTADCAPGDDLDGARLACVCSSDAVYADEGEAACRALSGADLARLYAAAKPGEAGDALRAAGVDELVYGGCDVLASLLGALDVVGVA